MPRACSVCRHTQRHEVDHALLSGKTYREITGSFPLSKSALERHRDHITSSLAKAKEAAVVANADSLLEQLKQLSADARRIQQKAEQARDYRAALAGVRELVRIVDLVARLSGELQERNETNIMNVHVDADVAIRMAEVYLSRRKPLERPLIQTVLFLRLVVGGHLPL